MRAGAESGNGGFCPAPSQLCDGASLLLQVRCPGEGPMETDT